MTPRKLNKLRQEVEGLRRKLGNIQARELVSLAGKVGRQPCNRGKEPTYEAQAYPEWFPLTIPQHSGGRIAKGTAASILNQLEQDLDALEEEEGDIDVEEDEEADG